jgi:thiopurine S-methyltransferase
MDHDFWHQRWVEDQLGFHQEKINSRLRKFWPQLGVAENECVFVPLCGKSLDMVWLASEDFRVFGVELSPIACRDFFTENGIDFQEVPCGQFRRFSGHGVELWSGDFFALTSSDLSDVRAVYDRASLVALPAMMRGDYANHLARVLRVGTEVLLLSMEYDQGKMNGPPFSVREEEVISLFERNFELELLSQASGPEIVGNLSERGLDTLTEKVYLLTRY